MGIGEISPPVVSGVLLQEVRYPSHGVQFYSDHDFLVDTVSRFLGTALGAGNSTVLVSTEEHRKSIERRLQDWGIALDTAADRGRYFFLDAADTLSLIMVDETPDPIRFAEVVGGILRLAESGISGKHGGVAVFGEMVALLWEQGKTEAAIRLERLWNDLARTHRFSLRCAYPLQGFDKAEHAAEFTKICAEHCEVIPAESYTTLGTNDERSRVISYLQQRAQALEKESEERHQAELALRASEAKLRAANDQLEKVVYQRTAALRRLSSQVLGLQDAERRRVARELHDSLGQYLSVLKLDIELLKQNPASDELWAESERLMDRCISEMRTLSYLLHPPMIDEAGLSSAARWYVEGFGERSGKQVTLQVSDDLGRLPSATELALFRVLQEALTNAHRHSGAAAIHVEICRNGDHVMLEIKDDGHGMKPEAVQRFRDTGASSGVGLTGMHERVCELGGDITLESDGTGTRISVKVPISNKSQRRSSPVAAD